jgi:hypothetical protein
MRFQVPQFTDVEDKIIGPLTLKQFIYLAGSIGICVVFFTFGAALAFYKVNNQPFIKITESFVKYFFTSKLYIWRNEEKEVGKMPEAPVHPSHVPKLSQSKLKDLAWSLGVKHDVTENVRDNDINL